MKKKLRALAGLIIAPTILLSSCGASKAPVEEPEVAEEIKPVKLQGKGFTIVEAYILDFLQDRGITDKGALATILGNIKAESNFRHDVCEGGAIVPYEQCRRGGYGLIQWTTENRYEGLRLFANKYGGDPSDLETQLRYMVNEAQFVKENAIWKRGGQSIDTYMRAAYRWLGWGIHGNRTHYSHDYYNRLS